MAITPAQGPPPCHTYTCTTSVVSPTRTHHDPHHHQIHTHTPAAAAGIRQPYALLLQEGLSPSARKDARAVADIRAMAEAAGAAVRNGISKHELNMLSGNRCGSV